MGDKKVSIIMGVYNCESTIEECIKSILNQTYKNWELIICDDFSSDNTYEIVKKFKKIYPEKIKMIRNESNLTLGPTLNRCLSLANGDYIARHDGDDISLENRLEKQVEFLNKNIQIDLVGCAIDLLDDITVYGKRSMKKEPNKIDYIKGSTFAHPTIMTRNYVYKELSGYSEEVDAIGVEDYELWIRFFENGFKGYNICESLYVLREDRNSYRRKIIKRRINGIKIMRKGIKRLNLGIIYNLLIFRSIIAIIVPKDILRKYHRKKYSKLI